MTWSFPTMAIQLFILVSGLALGGAVFSLGAPPWVAFIACAWWADRTAAHVRKGL
jgi:hypothetical protein